MDQFGRIDSNSANEILYHMINSVIPMTNIKSYAEFIDFIGKRLDCENGYGFASFQAIEGFLDKCGNTRIEQHLAEISASLAMGSESQADRMTQLVKQNKSLVDTIHSLNIRIERLEDQIATIMRRSAPAGAIPNGDPKRGETLRPTGQMRANPASIRVMPMGNQFRSSQVGSPPSGAFGAMATSTSTSASASSSNSGRQMTVILAEKQRGSQMQMMQMKQMKNKAEEYMGMPQRPDSSEMFAEGNPSSNSISNNSSVSVSGLDKDDLRGLEDVSVSSNEKITQYFDISSSSSSSSSLSADLWKLLCDKESGPSGRAGALTTDWRSVKPCNLINRTIWHSLCSVDRHVYVLGGFQNGRTWSERVQVFDINANRWTLHRSKMPIGRSSHASGQVDGIIYVIGGRTMDNQLESTVDMFDTHSGKWKANSHKPIRLPRFGLSTSSLGGLIFAVGGNDGDAAIPTVDAFNPNRNGWVEVASMNVGRSNHTSSVVDGKIFAVGGWRDGRIISEVESFDAMVNEWIVEPPLSEALDAHASCVWGDNTIVVVGGRKPQGNNAISEVSMLDVRVGKWMRHSRSLTKARFDHKCCIVDSFTMMAIGGRKGLDGAFLDEVEAFDMR
eukprot:TRINITY_DN2682_c0_g1_i1.p1 TRINITY_DN2682_c0_g1~~TRINITY_DN2682_c0_g1_i1.p1  ORF type:complete len:682 (+),score=166.94 TRINITY_DN2682_c0_g1_i1:201-2048(+)